ncbi:MAG: PQQ-binding-like beta-propeller repeat protein [Bacillota bacterium]|nr:PQQ-binding-like beta-propeller repeat protein [Bacillota bacterium]
MRGKVILIILVLILTGCTSNSNTIEIAKLNNEIEMQKISYEQKLEDLRFAYEEQIKELKSTNVRDDDQVQIDSFSIDVTELQQKLEKCDSEYNIMKRILFNKNNDTNSLYDDIYLEDKVIKLYSERTNKLEDGIICVLEVFDNNNNIIWDVSWGELQVTELPVYSPVAVVKDKIYIVVSGELNALDINTGQVLWKSVFVGLQSHPPRVSEDGHIYVTGIYGPFLTSINKEGIVEWQVELEEMAWSFDVAICNNYILVEWSGGIAVFDKDGNMLE